MKYVQLTHSQQEFISDILDTYQNEILDLMQVRKNISIKNGRYSKD